jgi:hypothetical protein
MRDTLVAKPGDEPVPDTERFRCLLLEFPPISFTQSVRVPHLQGPSGAIREGAIDVTTNGVTLLNYQKFFWRGVAVVV